MLLVLFSCILHGVVASSNREQPNSDADMSSVVLLQTSAQMEPASLPEELKAALKLALVGERAVEHSRNDPFYHYWVIAHATRHQHREMEYRRTVLAFLKTAGVLEVCLVVVTLMVFTGMYGRYLDWPNEQTPHCPALCAWIAWGIVCVCLVLIYDGPNESAGFLTGYALELIFSIENVFIFHVVCKAFKAPGRLIQKALFVVVICQVLFQAIFFMGLAHWLHQSQILPYILGAWLIYVGVEACRNHSDESVDIKESTGFKWFHSVMGKRLAPEFPEDGHVFFTQGDQWCCTMLGPLIVSLCIIDCLFEVDVTLTKIEELDKSFMCFSSSVVAACAVPELYFVARGLFDKYSLLRYGISFALVFYGVQLLAHNFFELPALTGIGLVLGVMALCMSCSDVKGGLVSSKTEGPLVIPRSYGAAGEAAKSPETEARC